MAPPPIRYAAAVRAGQRETGDAERDVHQVVQHRHLEDPEDARPRCGARRR